MLESVHIKSLGLKQPSELKGVLRQCILSLRIIVIFQHFVNLEPSAPLKPVTISRTSLHHTDLSVPLQEKQNRYHPPFFLLQLLFYPSDFLFDFEAFFQQFFNRLAFTALELRYIQQALVGLTLFLPGSKPNSKQPLV